MADPAGKTLHVVSAKALPRRRAPLSILKHMESMPLYESAAIRWLELEVEKRHGVTPYTLMQRAAAAALVVCQRHFPAARRLHVVCGPGNNGGDGVELAHQATKCGYEVRVITRFDPKTRRGAAADAWRAWLSAGRGVDAAVLSDVRAQQLGIDAIERSIQASTEHRID
ncbi:MAG: NAD(P)H-hydrate epimerase, partial [Pseudomonadota bacterium]